MPKAKLPMMTWLPLELDQDILQFSCDRTQSCCGVLEIGFFSTSRNPFRDVRVSSKQTKTEEYKTHEWREYGNGISDPYVEVTKTREVPVKERPATYDEILKAFKKEQDEIWSKDFGLGVTYLLPVQQNGPWGRLFKDLGWTDTGKFWNPKTRHTLHHWVKTFRKGPPGKKKSVKSILNRS